MTKSLGNKAARGVVWTTVEKFGLMGMQFVVNLILARLLAPADFGTVGMLVIFITVSNMLIDSGLCTALIQKKEPTPTDYSTILTWSISFSIVLYALLWVLAPFVADFYSMPLLKSVLRVMGVNLIVSGVLTVQRVKIEKALEFRTIAVTDLTAYFIGASFAIFLAYTGFGVWSLVLMQITYGILSIIILAVITRWNPGFRFSRTNLKELFGYGGFLMSANILQQICVNIPGVIIGKRFSAAELGYYSQAYKLDAITSNSIPQVILQVMFPVFSAIQDDLKRLREVVMINIRMISFIVFPILAVLILLSEPLIIGLYGTIWQPVAPYFRIFCVGGFFICLQNVNFYAVAAVGKSRTLFMWSFYKWAFMIVALLIGMYFGMYGIMWATVLSNLNVYLLNVYLSSKYIGLSVREQVSALMPIAGVTLVSFLIGVLAGRLSQTVFVGGIVTILLYVSLSFAFRLKALKDTRLIVEKLIKKN